MKNAKLTTLICGLISIAATVIFYLLTFDNIFTIPMRWVSLMLLLVAEVIGTLKAIFVNKNIITQASIFTSVAHLVAVLVISIVFVNFFPLAIRTYILLNILLLCAMAAADLFVSHFGKNISASNKKLAQSQSVMDACYAKAQGLVVVYGQSEYKKDLIEISELIKYSDNSELTDDEPAIMGKLGELESQLKENGENISALISEIKNLINLRTIKMKSIKRGGY
ncbi:MAG: hypothetical protein IKU26_04460 [Clostridia bacterium]|nr:hypothetical protein [Clostridia bacterium]